jgi:hypothetical protein
MEESCYHTEFEVIVIAPDAEDFCVRGAKYASLPEKSEYKLKLVNKGDTRADADVMLDGKEVGRWRVNAYSSIIVERPTNQQRKFVFVSEVSPIARRTGTVAGLNENGLVKVVFTPEIRYVREISYKTYEPVNSVSERRRYRASPSPESAAPTSRRSLMSGRLSPTRAGVTVLGNRSDQSFVSVDTITRIDYDRITTIMIRLVVKETAYTGLQDIRKGRYPERL